MFKKVTNLMELRKILKRTFYILSTPKLKYVISKKFCNQKYNILDIGCGGNSPYLTKLIYPNCRYVGIDRDFSYHNSQNSINLIDKKIKHDLNDDILNLEDKISDEKFDIIIFNHTIEHTTKGLDILKSVITKLNTNGCIYIEFPSVRSLNLPSMRGTLNFCDDNTHLRIYTVQEIANLLLRFNCKIIKGGRRFNLFSILIIPIRILNCIIYIKFGF